MKYNEGWQYKVAAVLPARRPKIACILISAFVFSLMLVVFGLQFREEASWKKLRTFADDVTMTIDHAKESLTAPKKPKDQLHILLPVTKSDPKLCRNLLAQTILGYPRPQLLMWGQEFNDERFSIGKGSHLAKITEVLRWLEDPANQKYEDDLVIMTDAYDIWFQLPPETLINRYYDAIAAEDKRIKQRLGRAADIEKIRSKVLFSASKRCGPNYLNSVACYPVPESTLPKDVYGQYTDTMDLPGDYKWGGLRQRHLVSGFIMGPFKDMRRVFAKANEKMVECLNGDMKGTKFIRGNCHAGSDQSYFNEMYGEQWYHRELMRRHHHSGWDDFMEGFFPDRPGSTPKPAQIELAWVEDPVNPPFDHMLMKDPEYSPDQPYEFGILVDEWSRISHQTSNAMQDTAYINHSAPLAPQIQNPHHGLPIVCNAKAPMPNDIPREGTAFDLFPEDMPNRPTWENVPLYSEVCAGVVPVVAHHNWYHKEYMDKLWDQNWWTGHARFLFDERRRLAAGTEGGDKLGGADTDTGKSFTWDDLCPVEWDDKVFTRPAGEAKKKPQTGEKRPEGKPAGKQ